MTERKLYILGSFQLKIDDRTIPQFRYEAMRGLLAYLALNPNTPIPRTTLMSLLWPEKNESEARHLLRQVLYHLRKIWDDQNESDSFITSRQTVQFNPPPDFWLDCQVFEDLLDACAAHTHRRLDSCSACAERLWQAAALYRDDLLAGFSLPGCDLFEEWRVVRQEGLHRRMLDTLTHLSTYHERRREHEAAGGYLLRQIELEPWREEAHRALMLSLAMNGEASAAMAQYEHCRQVLANELNIQPSSETVVLYERIRDGDIAPVFIEPISPYKGLLAFNSEDAADFFGRETQTQNLLKAVQNESLVAVVSPSGCGKSSLIHAGLIPALLDNGDQEGSVSFIDMRPGETPFQNLAEALAAHLDDPSAQGFSVETLTNELKEGTRTLSDIAFSSGDSGQVFMVVDQFEELYTLCPDPGTQHAFIDVLIAPGFRGESPKGGQLTAIIAMRADFTSQALSYRPLAEAIQRGRFILGPMSRPELQRAIEEPARNRGVLFEPGLVERLLDDVADEPGNLPLLQFTLTQLWEKQTGGQLTHDAYEGIGSLTGALTRYADGIYKGLDDDQRDDARRVFASLVRPGENIADTRRVVSRDELSDTDWQLAQHLADARLLVTNRERSGKETVDLAHEALIQHWGRLRDWIDADRAFYLWRRRLQASLRQWEANNRDQGALLRGATLAEAEGWLSGREAELSPAASQFIQASMALRDERGRQEEELRQRELEQAQTLAETRTRAGKRLRWLSGGLAVLFILAVGIALFARNEQFKAQRSAEVANSLNLSTSAQFVLAENDSDLALALAIEANQIEDPPLQARLMLAEAAYAPGTRRILEGHQGPVQAVAVSPDGSRALSGSADSTLILWDLTSSEIVRRFKAHTDAVNAVAYLPAGDQAISASADGTLILWDLASGEIIRNFQGHLGPIWDVAVNPDGETALSGGDDQTLILWNLQTGGIIQRLEGHPAAVLSLDISPDGSAVLSGTADGGLFLWDLETGAILLALPGSSTITAMGEARGHAGEVWGVAFLPDPDGGRAVSASADHFVYLWDFSALLFPGDAAGTSLDSTEKLPQEESQYQVQRFNIGSGLHSSIAPSADGRTLLVGTLNNQVNLLNLMNGGIVPQLTGHSGRVLAVAFAPDPLTGEPERTAISASIDGSLRTWNLFNGAERRCIKYPMSDAAAADVAISPDGRLGLTGLFTGEIALWDYASGVEIRRLKGHSEMVFGGVGFTPDGKYALSASGDIFAAAQDSTLRLWDVATGDEVARFEGHTNRIWDLDLSPDGRWAATAAHDGTLRLWDISIPIEVEGRILLDVAPQAPRSVAFSPDGRTLAVGLAKWTASNPDYAIRLIEVETGHEIRRLTGHSEVVADLAFSPDGKRLLSGSVDAAVILWDVESGEQIHRLGGHNSYVNAVAFHPGGRLAASGAGDGSVILWDTEAGEALRRFSPLNVVVVGIDFMPDGASLLVAADDDAIHEYRIDASTADLLAWVSANRFVPELTCQQREQYNVTPLCEE